MPPYNPNATLGGDVRTTNVTLTLRLGNPMINSMALVGVNGWLGDNRVPVKVVSLLAEAQQEQAWIDAVNVGDANAFQYLVETHQSRVYNLALRMLGNEQEAQDAAQDAFVQAYIHLASYRPEWRFKTWIMAIASNLCIDRLRRRRIEPVSFSDHVEDPDAEFVSHEPQPDIVAAHHERRAVIHAMLQQLPPNDRSMVIMFYWGGMSYDEIAHATDSTVNAVKSRLFRARRAMAQSPLASQLDDTGLGVMA
jgi:RNA polymerase sigma-70 factor, ECF subfamily